MSGPLPGTGRFRVLALPAILSLVILGGVLPPPVRALSDQAQDAGRTALELRRRMTRRGFPLPGELESFRRLVNEVARDIPRERLPDEPDVLAFLQSAYLYLWGADSMSHSWALEQAQQLRIFMDGRTRSPQVEVHNGVMLVVRGDSRLREVALTFDDGPAGRHTEEVLDVLAEEGVRATFFLIGNKVRAQPDRVIRIVSDGHVVGNHSRTHARRVGLGKLDDAQVESEIAGGQELINRALGHPPQVALFRCPYGSGARSDRVNGILARYAPYSVYWTIDPKDWKRPGPDVVYERVVSSHLLPGAIVLLHDAVPGTAEVARRIIRTLKKRGYRFVTVPELLSLDGPDAALRAFRTAAEHYEQGEFALAVETLLEEVDRNPNTVLTDDLLDFAAMIEEGPLGDTQRASRLRGKIRVLFPESPYLGSALVPYPGQQGPVVGE